MVWITTANAIRLTTLGSQVVCLHNHKVTPLIMNVTPPSKHSARYEPYNSAKHGRKLPFVPHLAREAKAIVALAFRNGPIEAIHRGNERCPTCMGNPLYSRITGPEVKEIMEAAVNCMYGILFDKESDPHRYEKTIQFGEEYSKDWNDPSGIE
jgi:hypothetical protein